MPKAPQISTRDVPIHRSHAWAWLAMSCLARFCQLNTDLNERAERMTIYLQVCIHGIAFLPACTLIL